MERKTKLHRVENQLGGEEEREENEKNIRNKNVFEVTSRSRRRKKDNIEYF